ncbi:MAG: hypothetical protein SVX28_05615 [Pseudomonadota bacterium]|nr:hypothetical protein [Pseudomonadota bacterium]
MENDPLEPGFHVVRQSIDKADLIAQLYGDLSLKPERFDELNPLLGDRIKAGQVIVLGDPEGLQCTAEEQHMMAAAERVNSLSAELSVDEAQLATDYYDLIELLTSPASAGLGAGSVMVSRQLKGIESNLRELEELHQQSFRKYGNLSNPEFFQKRREILSRLDFALGKFARKGMSLDGSGKLKRALGLSSKSIVHYWKQAGVGNIPGYADHYERVATGARYMRATGYLAIGLDLAIAGHKIKEACTAGNDKACEIVSYRQGGRVTGSVIGGSVGAGAATVCTLVGLSTGGVGGIACAVLVGGLGSWVGGTYGGKEGEKMGGKLRQVIHE